MKTVPLHGPKAAGRVALVDDEDYDLVMQYRWNVQETSDDLSYALTNLPGGRKVRRGVFMHCLITGHSPTDHHDRNGLNNQRSNLRMATHGQNMANTRAQSGCASIYKGVTQAQDGRRWVAKITKAGKTQWLGTFDDEIKAAFAYDAAARQLSGSFARVNFPNRDAGEVGALDRLDDRVTTRVSAPEVRTHTPDRAGTSKFQGVCWSRQKGKWRATIDLGGKNTHLGFYLSEIEAALAYDDAAIAAYGERAQRNFPGGVPQAQRDDLRAEREAVQAANRRAQASAASRSLWASREPEERICVECGSSYMVRQTRPTYYCSTACSGRASYWRCKRRKSGEAA